VLERSQLVSSRYVGDFNEGDVYHHGCIQITPYRNREYIKKFRDGLLLGANPALAAHLGCVDPEHEHKRESFGIDEAALVSQGFVFNVGFGLSVHDISFNAIANLSYNDLRYGVPVFEGDLIYARSEVLGKEFRKDGAQNGSVQVKTTVYNQRGETVLEYVRQVLVRAARGKEYPKSSTIKPQPETIDLGRVHLPPPYKAIPRSLLGEHGKTFDELRPGTRLEGTFEASIDLVTFSWLQIATLNDASVHHNPASHFIGYGGAVKAMAEGAVSAHLPLAWHLGMNGGSHDAPTYPSDIVERLFGGAPDEPHERLRARLEVVRTETVEGRDDIGVVTVRLTADKYVTDAGMRALEAAGFRGVDKIYEQGGGRFLRVLTMEEVLAVPTSRAFR